MLRFVAVLGLVAVVTAFTREHDSAGDARLAVGCARDSLGSAVLVKNLQTIATETTYPYPTLRASLHIPPVAAAQVVLLSDSVLCANLAAVYDGVLVARGDQSNSARNVIVVQVGDRYAVQDPLETAGEWRVTVLLDSALQYLSIF